MRFGSVSRIIFFTSRRVFGVSREKTGVFRLKNFLFWYIIIPSKGRKEVLLKSGD